MNLANTIEKENGNSFERFWHPVGLTALIYLKEAVQQERYEDCASIIAIAREFGAQDEEIQNILWFYSK